MDKQRHLMSEARARLVLDHPFFGALALRLRLVEDSSIPTAWTDGVHLGYNPRFIGTLSTEAIKGLVCHEVMHCALQHHTRRGSRDPDRWNTAIDYVTNPIIIDAGMTLPPRGLIDPQYAGMSAEQVYALLPEDAASDKSGGGESGKGRTGSNFGSVRDAPGRDGEKASPSEIRQAEQDWKVALSQAAQQGRLAGSLPGSIARLVREILEPQRDWREILRQFVDQSARNDYSWSRPNRRHIGAGIYLPSLYSQELGRVVAAIDVSGSIGQRDLDEFAGEINAITADYRADCTVIYCDTRVQRVDEFPAGDTVTLSSSGGGGTDFRPPFAWIDENCAQPAVMLYFTDGLCSQFPAAPAYPVLWVQHGAAQFNPPFGEVLQT